MIEASFFLETWTTRRSPGSLQSSHRTRISSMTSTTTGWASKAPSAASLQQNWPSKLYLDGMQSDAGTAHLASALKKPDLACAQHWAQPGEPDRPATLADPSNTITRCGGSLNQSPRKKGAPHLKTIEAKLTIT